MKKVISIAMSIILLLGLTACGGSTEEKYTEKNTTTHLNIAKQMVLGYIPLYIVEENGWIEEALKEAGYSDVEVSFTQFESGPPENEAFANGLMDLGVMGNVPAISGVSAGQERDIIGIAYNGEKTLGIVVQNDSKIKEVKELKGKKIGLVIGSISQDYLNAMLVDAGMTMSDVELINLGVSELETAIATKQVDAIAAWNPELLEIQANGSGVLLADGTGVYAGENVIVANRAYVDANPDIVRIFMEQYQRGVDELLSDPEAYAEKYAEITGLSKELLIQTWENSNFPVQLTEKDQEQLEKTAKFLYDYELISNEVVIKDCLDYSFSEEE